MTTPSAALRKAVEVALKACVFRLNRCKYPNRTDIERGLMSAIPTLRAWLASGLSDDERATVGRVVNQLEGLCREGGPMNKRIGQELIDALRPIAEGGRE